MIQYNQNASYSDLVTLDTTISQTLNGVVTNLITTYVKPGGTGDIVWLNGSGVPQYLPAAQANQLYKIAATKIVTTATVNGVVRDTTATNIAYLAVSLASQ